MSRMPKLSVCFLMVIVAVGLKYHYSKAKPADLRWILGPVTTVVGIVEGREYWWDENEGFVRNDKRIIIAPSCAGVNFMIIAFCLTALRSSVSARSVFSVLWCIPGSLAAAFLITTFTNALRIVTAATLFQSGNNFLSSDFMHRIHGIAVFFTALVLFNFGLQILPRFIKSFARATFPSSDKPRYAGSLPTVSVYLIVTVVIPIILGLWRKSGAGMAEHALITVSVCVSLLFLFLGVQKAGSCFWRKARPQ